MIAIALVAFSPLAAALVVAHFEERSRRGSDQHPAPTGTTRLRVSAPARDTARSGNCGPVNRRRL